jgi:methionine aminopeptidase
MHTGPIIRHYEHHSEDEFVEGMVFTIEPILMM